MKNCSILISGLLLAIVAAPASADVITDLKGCTNIADSKDRLDCFDMVAAHYKNAKPYSGQAPAAATAPRAQDPVDTFGQPEGMTPEQEFGLEKQAELRTPDELVSTIPGEFDGWHGKSTFTLANGQVWQQTDNARFTHHATNPEVVIEKGVWGSFRMKVDGLNRSIPVKRIK